MAILRRHNGNGAPPSGNGDPFRNFVIQELVELRRFRERQEHAWRIQDHYWKLQEKKGSETLSALRKINDHLDHQELINRRQDEVNRRQDEVNRRQDEVNRRQDRANRILLQQIRRLRKSR